MRKLFVRTPRGNPPLNMETVTVFDDTTPLMVSNNAECLTRAAYELGYQDAKNEPFWKLGTYYIANTSVGGLMKDPRCYGAPKAEMRFKAWIEDCPHYGGRIIKFFFGPEAFNEAKAFVEKHAKLKPKL